MGATHPLRQAHSLTETLDCINGAWEVGLACTHCSLFLDCGCDVTSCLKLLMDCHLKLWAAINPFTLALPFVGVFITTTRQETKANWSLLLMCRGCQGSQNILALWCKFPRFLFLGIKFSLVRQPHSPLLVHRHGIFILYQ